MRLADWLTRHQERLHTNTYQTATIVYAKTWLPMGRELFALDDYVVSSVCGDVVYLVPRPDSQTTRVSRYQVQA